MPPISSSLPQVGTSPSLIPSQSIPPAASPKLASPSSHLHREPPPAPSTTHLFFPTPPLSPTLRTRLVLAHGCDWVYEIPGFLPVRFGGDKAAALPSPQSACPSDVACHHPPRLFSLHRYVKAVPYESGFHCSCASRRTARHWLPYPNTSPTADAAVPPCGVSPPQRLEGKLGRSTPPLQFG